MVTVWREKEAENADLPTFNVADTGTEAVHVSYSDINFPGLERQSLTVKQFRAAELIASFLTRAEGLLRQVDRVLS